MNPVWWAEPAAGDIVWCRFPDNGSVCPKARPALIVRVLSDGTPPFHVEVAYGTSQRTTTLYKGEFSILRNSNRPAFFASGLSYDTKFNLKRTVELPYTSEWFSIAPNAPHGQTPKLGTLHKSLMAAVEAAYRATRP